MTHSKPKRILTSDSKDLSHNPFSSLDIPNLSASIANPSNLSTAQIGPTPSKPRFKGRIDIRRETHGRGGKTVTTIVPENSLDNADLKEVTHFLKNQLGCGGTFKENSIELQGDRREQVKPLLEELGFRVVFCGG